MPRRVVVEPGPGSALVGTLDEMVDELEWRRAEYGISYWSIESDAWEALAPVVARLAGT